MNFLKVGYFKRFWQFLLLFESLSSHSVTAAAQHLLPLLSLDEQWWGFGMWFLGFVFNHFKIPVQLGLIPLKLVEEEAGNAVCSVGSSDLTDQLYPQ